MIKTYKHINFVRNYECTNIKYIQTSGKVNEYWIECDESEIKKDNAKQIDLITMNGSDCRRFGWL